MPCLKCVLFCPHSVVLLLHSSPSPTLPFLHPKTPDTPTLMGPCWPSLTLISVLATLQLEKQIPILPRFWTEVSIWFAAGVFRKCCCEGTRTSRRRGIWMGGARMGWGLCSGWTRSRVPLQGSVVNRVQQPRKTRSHLNSWTLLSRQTCAKHATCLTEAIRRSCTAGSHAVWVRSAQPSTTVA